MQQDSTTPDSSARDVVDLRRRLRHVRISSERPALDRFPNFLIVGPQRTGTTWLASNLRLHPQVFVSEPKEIYFFNMLDIPGHPRYRTNDLSWYLNFFRDSLTGYLGKMARCLLAYREVYRPLVRGEATASYAAMSTSAIEDIVVLNPDIRVILMVRNPVERAWSHAKKDLAKRAGRRVSDIDDGEFRAFFSDPYQLKCGRYTELIDGWSAALKDGHLFVGIFDEISSRPEELLSRVYGFLGVANDPKYAGSHARERVNPTADAGIPDEYREYLEGIFSNELARLRDRYSVDWR